MTQRYASPVFMPSANVYKHNLPISTECSFENRKGMKGEDRSDTEHGSLNKKP
jgi:hypothetical protein